MAIIQKVTISQANHIAAQIFGHEQCPKSLEDMNFGEYAEVCIGESRWAEKAEYPNERWGICPPQNYVTQRDHYVVISLGSQGARIEADPATSTGMLYVPEGIIYRNDFSYVTYTSLRDFLGWQF